jgi:hypothetical protein
MGCDYPTIDVHDEPLDDSENARDSSRGMINRLDYVLEEALPHATEVALLSSTWIHSEFAYDDPE